MDPVDPCPAPHRALSKMKKKMKLSMGALCRPDKMSVRVQNPNTSQITRGGGGGNAQPPCEGEGSRSPSDFRGTLPYLASFLSHLAEPSLSRSPSTLFRFSFPLPPIFLSFLHQPVEDARLTRARQRGYFGFSISLVRVRGVGVRRAWLHSG
jgi:hypothetical protein